MSVWHPKLNGDSSMPPAD